MKKNKYLIIALCIIFTFALLQVYYAEIKSHEVSFTDNEQEYISKNQRIYIAGNPDLLPIEFYSKDNGKYIGILPDFFNAISEMSGISFEYVNLGVNDNRYTLAKNMQVEIMSSFQKDVTTIEQLKLITSKTLMTLPDSNVEICFAYTSIAPPELISIMQKCIDSITHEQKETIYLKHGLAYVNRNISFKFTILNLVILCILLVIVIIITVIIMKNQNKKYTAYYNTDEITGYNNLKMFISNYTKYTNINNRVNYYLVQIDINIEYLTENYGFFNTKEIIKLISEAINANMQGDEFFSVINASYFALLIRVSNKSQLSDRLLNIEEKILSSVRENRNYYDVNICMGVYALKQADMDVYEALYKAMQAKNFAKANKLSYAIFDKSIESKLSKEMHIAQEVIQGILNNEFIVYLQPYFNLKENTLQGCEALVRWENKRAGLLKPNDFIPVLEKNNMIDKLDLLMFENVCKILESRKKDKKDLFWISCNFSKQSFLNPDFANMIFGIANKYNVPPQYLLIEITEGLELDNKNENNTIINQLINYGFPLVVDNFGSGYSSFTNLSKYPINFVKMDRKIVQNIESENMKIITEGLADIMRTLDIKIMCNGIESESQVKLIKEMNFDYAQGHFFFYPMHSDEFLKLYDSGKLDNNLFH